MEEFDDDDLNTSSDEMDNSSVNEDEEYISDDCRKSSVEPNMATTSPSGSTHTNHDFDVVASGMPAKKIDFSGVDSADRMKKRDKGKSTTITEECV